MTIETGLAISHLVPGASFLIIDEEITWNDDRPQPTQEEIDATILLLPSIEAEKSKRSARNNLLTASDWTVLPDSPLSTEEAAVWMTYRQELRDFTALDGWVDLPFPAKP